MNKNVIIGNYIGIDLGISGGIAVINYAGTILNLYRMPKTPEEQISLLLTIVDQLTGPIYIYMEQVSARPGEGVSSVHKFGYHCGGIYYTCMLLSIENDNVVAPTRISPTLWKKHFGLIDSTISKYEKKKLSVTYVNNIYNKSLKYSDNGLADAILIAEYARTEINAQYTKE